MLTSDATNGGVQMEISDCNDCLVTKTVLGDESTADVGVFKTRIKSAKEGYFARISYTNLEVQQILTISIIVLLSWGVAYLVCGAPFGVSGGWFRLALTSVLGHACGQMLHRVTSLPPLLGALLAGVAAANLGVVNIREHIKIDSFLRKIYPVIILGKSALGADFNYIHSEAGRVFGFGLLPWTAEVSLVTVCARFILSYPWKWGLILGAMSTSPSPAVPLPIVQRLYAKNLGVGHELPCLVANAGIVDTFLSVGVYGIFLTAIFSEDEEIYAIFKGCLTMFVGVGLGVAWGYLASVIPNKNDPFMAESRFLIVFLGGLFANFGTLAIGWGGTGGVAVLICNMTAAYFWNRSDWKFNSHPVSTVYRVLWNIFEPTVFAFTGAHFLISDLELMKMASLLGVLAVSLPVRLLTAFLVAWRCGFRAKERLFFCFTWMPKAILEAVLGPTALEPAISGAQPETDVGFAETNIHMSVLVILVTVPLGHILAKTLGSRLLSADLTRRSTFLEEATTAETKRLPVTWIIPITDDTSDKTHQPRLT